jgi:excinuclease UvrABC ATPase subunit
MPSKKRVHLQQSGIISLANPRSNLHQESWEKQVDLPNYWDNHKLCKWVGKSYKKIVLHRDNHKSMSFEMQNHTHTQITVIIDTLEQGYNAAISSWRDMQNHTHTDYSHHLIHQNKVTMRPYLHDEICQITHTHRSCSQVVNLAAHGHWISSISIDGLENWFLAFNETTKLSEPTLLFARAFREWREKA